MITIILTDDNTIEQTLSGETRAAAFEALARELAERNGEERGLKAATARGDVRDTDAVYPRDIPLASEPEAFWTTLANHFLADSQDYQIVA